MLSIDVTYTVSGGPGNYLYNFTLENNMADPIGIYGFGLSDASDNLTNAGSSAGWGRRFSYQSNRVPAGIVPILLTP